MKIEGYVKKEFDIRTVKVILPVRYDEEDIPNDFPLRKGDIWEGTINVDNGHILEWPKGQTGDMHMKVCDEGVYSLFDENNELVAEIEQDYVPNRLIPPHDGYGDYIHFIIDENGFITNWYKEPEVDQFFPEE
jgi:hypothetical protein